MEKTSYKLSDDNVINLCTIKIFMVEQGWWLSCLGGNSERCLTTKEELDNLSQSNLKDWVVKVDIVFRGGGDLDDVTTPPPHKFFIIHLVND